MLSLVLAKKAAAYCAAAVLRHCCTVLSTAVNQHKGDHEVPVPAVTDGTLTSFAVPMVVMEKLNVFTAGAKEKLETLNWKLFFFGLERITHSKHVFCK